eukprot:c16712_g1_i1 orf=257-1249(-)
MLHQVLSLQPSLACSQGLLQVLRPSVFNAVRNQVLFPQFGDQSQHGLGRSYRKGSGSQVTSAAAGSEILPSAEELKWQLEALQTEAEQARRRANSARARFMRLMEAAEKLRIQAALDVKSGKDESARQLLADKRKVMKALQNAKLRSELLESLSTKIAEAISVKETQLIAALPHTHLNINTARDANDGTETIRVVCPRDEVSLASVTEETSSWEGDIREGLTYTAQLDEEVKECQNVSYGSNVESETEKENGLDVSSIGCDNYSGFLRGIDGQLNDVELRLQGFLYVATMILQEPVGTPVNMRVSAIRQIWHDVQNLRVRVRKALQDDRE